MISIIVAVYNIEQYVRLCIDSIISQSCTDWQLILVNDGSTDRSGEICKKYSDADSRITYIEKSNGGLSSARNEGVKYALGSWIMFVDGDDYIHRDTVAVLSRYSGAVDSDIDFIQYGFQEVDTPAAVISPFRYSEQFTRSYDKAEMFEYLLINGGEAASMCTKLLRRELFTSLNFKEGIIHEDEQFVSRLLLIAQGVAYIVGKPYIYVKRASSITTSQFSAKRLDIIPIMNERLSILDSISLNTLSCKFRVKFYHTLSILYLASFAKRDYKSAHIILNGIICQARSILTKSISMPLSSKLKLILTAHNMPPIMAEAIARRLMHKEVIYR